MGAAQFRITEQAEPRQGQTVGEVAFFDEDGNPVNVGGGDAGPVAWGDVTGKPATFPPATHTHTIANVTGLQAALDALSDRLDAVEE